MVSGVLCTPHVGAIQFLTLSGNPPHMSTAGILARHSAVGSAMQGPNSLHVHRYCPFFSFLYMYHRFSTTRCLISSLPSWPTSSPRSAQHLSTASLHALHAGIQASRFSLAFSRRVPSSIELSIQVNTTMAISWYYRPRRLSDLVGDRRFWERGQNPTPSQYIHRWDA